MEGAHGGAAAEESSTVVDASSGSPDAEEKPNDEEGDELSSSVQRRLDLDDESSAVEKAKEKKEEKEEDEEDEEEEIGDDAEADAMAARMELRLAALPGKAHESEPFTIFRVAGPMRERNRHLFEPQMVSIGPFHRGSGEHLAAMEAHKWRHLRDLLSRPGCAPLRTIARAARAMEPRARRRYASPVAAAAPPATATATMSAAEFAEMLLLDGCFLVEFFLKGSGGGNGGEGGDALMDATWAIQNVYNDMLLLENQLPFFVLQRFYDLATAAGGDHFVSDVLVGYLTVDMDVGTRDPERTRPPDGEIHHLLHLYYHWFLPPEHRLGSSSTTSTASDEEHAAAMEELVADAPDERTPWQLPPATELRDAGVTIRAKRSPRSMVDVTFDPRSGALEFPAVESYSNRVTFANLLAYEQSRGRWELQRLVSYVLLMASAVHGRRDAEVLQRCGVFGGAGGGGAETAAFYAQLAELCPPPDFVDSCYAGLLRDVKEYVGRSWNRHRAVLARDYFGDPWTSMSAAAAVFLLVLTVVQTVYTVLPYYYSSPN